MFIQDKFIRRAVGNSDRLHQLSADSTNVKIVEFRKLIIDTDQTIRDIAHFLEVELGPVLVSPSLAGNVISKKGMRLIGAINDDPEIEISKSDFELLRYMVPKYGEGEKPPEAFLPLPPVAWRLRTSRMVTFIRRYLNYSRSN